MNIQKLVNWFRARNYADMREHESADELTQLKLMKLLYLAQGVSLAAYDKPLFNEDIVAWTYGPVIESVHHEYIHQRGIVNDDIPVTEDDWDDYKSVEQSESISTVLNAVYDTFGSMSSTDLVNLTHAQSPWRETRQNMVISHDKIRDYFKAHVVVTDDEKD
jgi:uncharacterized phage-associated protein